jgi:hypothetical protein
MSDGRDGWSLGRTCCSKIGSEMRAFLLHAVCRSDRWNVNSELADGS